MVAMTNAGPASPCINICSLDEQGYCRGCCRSRDEIAEWSSMAPARQWQVLRAVEGRLAASRRSVAG